ncbi:hypothetical protein RSAG8_12561, partial [Rhizoctonia solani AG-8 WAC10335]
MEPNPPPQPSPTLVAPRVPCIAPGVSRELATKESPTNVTAAPADYRPGTGTLKLWKSAIDSLDKMIDSSWSECSNRELKRRQEALPAIMGSILRLAAHGTGAELYATGVTATRREHTAFNTASHRSYPFLDSDDAYTVRETFIRYTSSYLGSSMCVSPLCPGTVVYGDQNRQNHPILPPTLPFYQKNPSNTFQYLPLKLQWQGGGSEVPYAAIAAEAAVGRFSIVTRDALPDSIDYLRNPLKLNEHNLIILMDHLRASERSEELPEHKRFQFNEPKPGWRMQGFMMECQPGSVMHYPPEAWAYALFQADIRTHGVPQRTDLYMPEGPLLIPE